MLTTEKQITNKPGGKVLSRANVWSPDSSWIVYDTRPDFPRNNFLGRSIEMVNIYTGEVKKIFESAEGSYCGIPSFHPSKFRVVFSIISERAAIDWQNNLYYRQGVIVDIEGADSIINVEAVDLSEGTPGALCGGTTEHLWDGVGEFISCSYYAQGFDKQEKPGRPVNLQKIAIAIPNKPVKVNNNHPRNRNGEFYSFVVSKTVAAPEAGSDEICCAKTAVWIGRNGYLRRDFKYQRKAVAFVGEVITETGAKINEIFVIDVPENLLEVAINVAAGKLSCGVASTQVLHQRRLTYTANRQHPGLFARNPHIQSSPDGSCIAFLMPDDNNRVQLWTIPTTGGEPTQLTENPWEITSAFSFSPDGKYIAHFMDNSVCLTEIDTGKTRRLTLRSGNMLAPIDSACVFSPDGKKIAYARKMPDDNEYNNQIFVLFLE